MTKDEIFLEAQSSGGIGAFIPTIVLKDGNLSMSARVLYGVITWKCNDKAYCWATNSTLGKEMRLSAKRVSVLLSELESQGHVEVEILRDEETNQVLRRNIYPIMKSSRGILTPTPENKHTYPQIQCDTIPENAEAKYKNININIQEKKIKKKRSSLPTWKPQRFEKFWAYYSAHARGESRAKAVRAWDKLKPDDALIATMGRALERQIESEDWKRGIGIPYASTWLNNARWEDVGMAKPPEEPPPHTPQYVRTELIDGQEVDIFE